MIDREQFRAIIINSLFIRMEHHVAISIIIPHYNIPMMLVRALQSIPKRNDVQVIVVDDGSPEADKYIERYPELSEPNVEFYLQPHSGSAGTMRNIGLEHAKGEWVTFVDADDFLSEEADKIFTEVQQYDDDIVFYRSKAVLNDDLSTPSMRNGYDNLFGIEPEEERERYFRYVYSFPIGKFVRRELITNNKIRFDEVSYWNDVYFCACIGICAKSIRVCDDILYVITERGDSVTSKGLENKKNRIRNNRIRLDVALRTYRLLKKHKVYMPVEAYHLYRAVGLFRSRDKIEYFSLLFQMIFIFPACTFYYIKKDLSFVNKKIWQIVKQ